MLAAAIAQVVVGVARAFGPCEILRRTFENSRNGR